MKYEKYDVEASKSFLRYEFYSNGPKGKVLKRVIYDEFSEWPGVYHLAFGDVNKDGEIDDLVVTDNHDGKKVLATVAGTVADFLSSHPDKIIYATGSTPSRTRLYRIAISNNLDEIGLRFHVFGLRSMQWQSFDKNTEYAAFMIAAKTIPLYNGQEDETG